MIHESSDGKGGDVGNEGDGRSGCVEGGMTVADITDI
jgi:hypothetical protein